MSKPESYWDPDLDDEVEHMTITVMEEDDDPEPTGLLDQHGNPLYRHKAKRPIGFRLG